MFAGYPWMADRVTQMTVSSYLMSLEGCSAWALEKVMKALSRGLVANNNLDYCPSGPLLASEARKWDMAREMFKGDTLEQVEARLEKHAVALLPTKDEMDEHSRKIMSQRLLKLAEDLPAGSLGAMAITAAGDDPEARDD